MSSKTKAEDNNCASPNAFKFNKQRKSKLAFRDFPLGCGRQRVSSESLNSLVYSEVPGSTDDSNSKDQLMVPFAKKERHGLATKVELLQSFLQDSQDNASVVNPSKISVCQTIELPNESGQVVAKVCQPWRRISAIRLFPGGCGRKTLRVSKVASATNGLDHNVPDVEKAHFGEQGEVTRNNGHRTNVSGNCRSLFGLEHPGHQVIVQALMATPNCPWRQKRRVYKSNRASNAAKSTPKKN